MEFTEEHQELRKTVRRFLEDRSGEAAVRAVMDTDSGYDADVWKQMAEQLGLQGLIVPADHGGAGLGPVEMMIVAEEMGRTLFCSPYLSSGVFAPALLTAAATDEAQGRLLPGLAAGQTLTAVALVDEGAGWDAADVKLEAQKGGDGHTLTGAKLPVLDGHTADDLLVVARDGGELAVFHVAGDAAGVERTLLPTLDLTRKLARVSFSGAKAQRISPAGDQTESIQKAIDLTLVALCAEQVGGAQACLETATDYAKTRMQFGRPIGSFQAIKHKCADMLIAVEFAKSAAYNAGFVAEDGEELSPAVHMAKSFCSEAFFSAAADTIQIHGGMGFTWEHCAHLYFKRAKSSSVLFGDAVHHRKQLAAQADI